jgi:hypothetical protein
VGVPAIVTELLVVLAESERPGGKPPLETVQVNGPTPPVAVTVASYAPCVLPEGSVVVVTVSAVSAAGVPEQPAKEIKANPSRMSAEGKRRLVAFLTKAGPSPLFISIVLFPMIAHFL